MRYLRIAVLGIFWMVTDIAQTKKISYTTNLGGSLIICPVKVVWHFEQRTIIQLFVQ
jgi:hypothetical protein